MNYKNYSFDYEVHEGIEDVFRKLLPVKVNKGMIKCTVL